MKGQLPSIFETLKDPEGKTRSDHRINVDKCSSDWVGKLRDQLFGQDGDPGIIENCAYVGLESAGGKFAVNALFIDMACSILTKGTSDAVCVRLAEGVSPFVDALRLFRESNYTFENAIEGSDSENAARDLQHLRRSPCHTAFSSYLADRASIASGANQHHLEEERRWYAQIPVDI